MASNWTGVGDEGRQETWVRGTRTSTMAGFRDQRPRAGLADGDVEGHRRESRVEVNVEGRRKAKRSPRNGDGAYVSMSGRMMITRASAWFAWITRTDAGG